MTQPSKRDGEGAPATAATTRRPLTTATLPLLLSICAVLIAAAALLFSGHGSSTPLTVWQAAPETALQTHGWANLSSTSSTSAGYARVGDQVRLRGQLRPYYGRVPRTSTIFVLPAGDRPTKIVRLPALLNARSVATIVIDPAGDVIAVLGSVKVQVLSLDGLSFSTA
jgi:hypothetical protein